MSEDLHKIIAIRCIIIISCYYFTFILGKRNVIKNLYPYHILLTTKAKDRRLGRSAKEKLSSGKLMEKVRLF